MYCLSFYVFVISLSLSKEITKRIYFVFSSSAHLPSVSFLFDARRQTSFRTAPPCLPLVLRWPLIVRYF